VKQLLPLFLLCFLLSACVTATKSVDRLGIRVGDHLVSKVEAVAIPCVAWKSSDSVSFNYPPEALCFFDPANAGILYPSTPRFAAGSVFNVVTLKRVNLFDSEQFLIYAMPEGSHQLVIIRDFQYFDFFATSKYGEP